MSRILASGALTLTLALGLLAASPALAHHSFAMFDFTKTLTLEGTVKEFQWTNPHVVLWLETDDGVMWTAELTSPGNLTRNGWTKRSLNPGDKVILELNPLRDGKHGGGFRKVTIKATGQVLAGGGPTTTKPGQ